MKIISPIQPKMFEDCEPGELFLYRAGSATVLALCSILPTLAPVGERWAVVFTTEKIGRLYVDEGEQVASFGNDFEFSLSDFEVLDRADFSVEAGDVLVADGKTHLLIKPGAPEHGGWLALGLEDCQLHQVRFKPVVARSWSIQLPMKDGRENPPLFKWLRSNS